MRLSTSLYPAAWLPWAASIGRSVRVILGMNDIPEPAKPEAARKSETLATKAYRQLRHDIISGKYGAGQKLNIQVLCECYQVGAAPMREALNRASTERLVTLYDLRGFSVAPIDEADLDDILKSRVMLNDFALRDSIRNGDETWENNLLIAHHKLTRIPFAAPNVDPAWELAHRHFHATLLGGCTARRILAFCEELFDSADRYRHMARLSDRLPRRSNDHKAIMEASLARREDEAVDLLTRHFVETAERCREMLRTSGHGHR